MDSYNLGCGWGGIEKVLECINVKVLVIGIYFDVLFLVEEQVMLAMYILQVQFEFIDSIYGYDGFFIEFVEIGCLV